MNKRVIFVGSYDEIEAGDPSIQWCIKASDGSFVFYESNTDGTIVKAGKISQTISTSNVEAEDDSSYFNIFTITLEASVSQIYRAYLIAESDVAGAAVCISVVASEAATEGYAIVKTPTGAGTVQADVLSISTTENEAPVTGLLAANVVFPIEVIIAVTAGATPGTLSIQVRPEAGTGAIAYIKTNSFYE
jgi:hypothetical protein